MRAGFTAFGYSAIRWNESLIGAVVVASLARDGLERMAARQDLLEELGSYASTLLGPQAEQHGRLGSLTTELRDIIDNRRFHSVFQPMVDLRSGEVRGYEALTRFDDGVPPDQHFLAAHQLGMGAELESVCVAHAIELAKGLPAGVSLSVKFSPSTIIAGRLRPLLAKSPRPLTIEITEHAAVENYSAIRLALRRCGRVKVSVDDAGAGFASLRHILELQPDYIKLDRALVGGIETDPARQALVAGLCHFATHAGTTLIAEGLETRADADTVLALGVQLGQGYLFGHPQPLA